MMLEGTYITRKHNFNIKTNSFRGAVRALIAVCETDSSIVSLLADKFKY